MRPSLSRKIWVARMPLLVGVIALACLTSVGTLIARAGSTASIGIEPDYYRKGLEWDRRCAEKARSAALGWNAALRVDLASSRVEVKLTDRDGAAVDGAVLSGELFAHAASSRRAVVALRPVEGKPGTYAAGIDAASRPAAGKWRVSLTAARGEDRFIIESDLEVAER